MNPFDEVLKVAFELHNAGRQREAEAACRVLLEQRPENGQLLFLLGMVLHKTSRDREAVEWLARAAEKDPGAARIFNGLGCAWQQLRDHSRAVESFNRARELEGPTTPNCYNLGVSWYRLGDLERAAGLFREAVELTPTDAESWHNLGQTLNDLNRLDESIAAYDRALQAAPDYHLARYGRAISLLGAGRLPEGFRDYQCRWWTRRRRAFHQPLWAGQPAPGQTLFIHAEQGFGDAIHMARFLPQARDRVGRVVLECRSELKTLFLHSAIADSVIAYGEPIPAFDFFVPMLNLPHALGVTLETIPNRTPYLEAPAADSLPPALAGEPSAGGRPRMRVGLVWAGNPGHHQDAARSIPLEKLAPVLQVPGVVFYSLQAPMPARDRQFFLSCSNLVDLRGRMRDFLATASIIKDLDLVITVDTAVAHLAGALDKPVWVFIKYAPDWRWMLDRADTPWYPTMRLFRQAHRDQWDPVILQIAEALRRRMAP